MGDLFWGFECELEPVSSLARPGFDHGRTGWGVKRAVNLHTFKPLRVVREEVFVLRLLRIEMAFPTSIAEPGYTDKNLPCHDILYRTDIPCFKGGIEVGVLYALEGLLMVSGCGFWAPSPPERIGSDA